MPSTPTLIFLIGCLLVFLGIVGGGVRIKDYRVPKLTFMPRILSASFGAALMLGVAVYLYLPTPRPLFVAAPPPPDSTKPSLVTVINRLRTGESSEHVEILVADEAVDLPGKESIAGTSVRSYKIEVNERTLQSSVQIPISGQSNVAYSLAGKAEYLQGDGQHHFDLLEGGGYFNLSGGKTFVIFPEDRSVGDKKIISIGSVQE